MVLRVCKYGEKILREKSRPVAVVDDDMRRLADDMIETMHDAKGVGLAAEQIGATRDSASSTSPRAAKSLRTSFSTRP